MFAFKRRFSYTRGMEVPLSCVGNLFIFWRLVGSFAEVWAGEDKRIDCSLGSISLDDFGSIRLIEGNP